MCKEIREGGSDWTLLLRLFEFYSKKFNRDDIFGICEECNNDRERAGERESGGEILLSRHN